MTKEELDDLISQGLSTRKIADKIGKSYCYVYSRLIKYGLKCARKRIISDKDKVCPRCKCTKPLEDFYPRRDRQGGVNSYCKSCSGEATNERVRETKRQCVAYKGGKCMKCGYDKSMAALEFHHRDPSEKEFSLSSGKFKSLENCKPELDKCDLLCANCHRELHENIE